MNYFKNSFLYLILFISGFCSLVYQVSWERLIRSHFGGDSISAYIVTSTFLLGLGLGAFIFRNTKKNSFNLYAKVEISIALLALLSYFLISNFSNFILDLFANHIELVNSRILLILFCSLIILPPCILMGATLPLVFKSFFTSQAYETKQIGFFYAFNTIGASIGILSIPFVFLNRIDLKSTLLIVGFVNLILGLTLFFLSKKKNLFFNNYKNLINNENFKNKDSLITTNYIYFFVFCSGGIALSMELIFFRIAAINFPSSALNFPIVLMIFLFFMSLGSVFFSTISKDSKSKINLLIGLLFLFTAFSILFFLIINSSYTPERIRFIFLKYLFMIAPFAFFQGGLFPLLIKLLSPKSDTLSNTTGNVYLINSLGAFLFTLIIQFLLFELIGTEYIILILLSISLICSLIISIKSNLRTLSKILALPFFMFFFIPENAWEFSRYTKYSSFHDNEKIISIEGESGFSSFKFNSTEDGNYQGQILINGQPMSTIPDNARLNEISIFPSNTKKQGNVLLLGLGGSNILKNIINNSTINSVDVVDWSYELPRLLSLDIVKNIMGDLINDNRVNIFTTDARKYLKLSDDNYDLIVDNLAYTSWIGSTNIRSTNYFYELKNRLNKNGVYILTNNYVYLDEKEAVIAGVKENFEYVYEFNERIIIAGNNRCFIDLNNLSSSCFFEMKNIQKYIESNTNELPGNFKDYRNNLSDFLIDLSNIKQNKNVKPIDDDFPRFEYRIYTSDKTVMD